MIKLKQHKRDKRRLCGQSSQPPSPHRPLLRVALLSPPAKVGAFHQDGWTACPDSRGRAHGKAPQRKCWAWGVCSLRPSSGPAREKFAVAMSEKGFLQDVCGTSETQVDNVDISWHKCGAPTRGPWYSVTRRSHREAASASYSVRKSFFLLLGQRRK